VQLQSSPQSCECDAPGCNAPARPRLSVSGLTASCCWDTCADIHRRYEESDVEEEGGDEDEEEEEEEEEEDVEEEENDGTQRPHSQLGDAPIFTSSPSIIKYARVELTSLL
jgi:hypothetical protein